MQAISSPEVIEDHSHLYREVVNGDRRIYYCLIADCGKDFRFKSELNRHLAVHTKQRPYVCTIPLCGKTFKRPDALTHHVKMHTENVVFTCPLEGCGTQFATKAALKYHTLKHEGQKNFKCSYPGCGRAFITLAQLKQHERAAFYHQKINANIPIVINKQLVQENQDNLVKRDLLVKEETLSSDSPSTGLNSSSPSNGEAYKQLKTGAETVHVNNIITNLNSLKDLSMTDKLAWDAQVNNQNNTFGPIDDDQNTNYILRALLEENLRLKQGLNGIMSMSFGGLYNNSEAMQSNMKNSFDFQPADLNLQRMAALQYNLSM